MTVLSPAEMRIVVDDIRRLAPDIEPWYSALHAVGFEARVGGQPGDGTTDEDDLARLVVTTGAARAKLERASYHAGQAVAAIQGCRKMLAELEGLIDEGVDRTLHDPVADRARRRPEEWPGVRDAIMAQERRRARGEVSGAARAELRAADKRLERLRKQHEAAHPDAAVLPPVLCPRCRHTIDLEGAG